MALIRWPLTVVGSMLLFLCCSAKEYYCEYRSGGVNYEQYDLHNDGITVDNRTSITFETRGNNDAHILLQHDRNEFFSNVIEIVIGGWANGKSVIRNAQQGSNLDEYSSTILESSTYQWFWITWDEGCVQVGKGDSVGSSRIMNWCGFTYNITGMRVSCGFGSDGYFRFPDPDTDECLSNPCQNGATCHNNQNSYSCTCVRGWTGTDCDKDINECASNPCQNGASCNNLLDQYTCSCAGGWQGYTCDQDIDECASSPCQNSALCVNGQNQYTCLCDGGWHGTQCELDTDECLSNPCQNGATCHNNQNSYSCTCVRGWTGTDCDKDIDECASTPCQNGATCNNLLDRYTCGCAGGWHGYDCDIDYDECVSNPCQNGATCNNLLDHYTCDCAGGWQGYDCNVDIDECANNPCQNGATCSNLLDQYTCDCAGGWQGYNCDQDIDECLSSPCVNGTCSNLQNAYSCTCLPMYTAKNCDYSVVDGNWGAWSDATSCSATCGQGRTTRTRQCDNPAPSNGGNMCSGENMLMETCILQNCTYSQNTTNGYSLTTAYVNVCPKGHFTCKSGGIKCIQDSFACDCMADCEDGSDVNQIWAGCLEICSGATGLRVVSLEVLLLFWTALKACKMI